MEEEEKITIIEGPPPVFEGVPDAWPMGLNESPTLSSVVLTRLRTFNGPRLVERCYRAWRQQHTIHLEFRAPDGLPHKAPIVAARHLEVEEGQILLLWVRLIEDEMRLELGYDGSSQGDDDDSQ
jgi:hypothetical protein